MLTCFSALNESSNADGRSSDDSSSSSGEELPEYQDEDFLTMYNMALTSYASEDYSGAERAFRRLIDTEYFLNCGHKSGKPRPVASKLEYNTYR